MSEIGVRNCSDLTERRWTDYVSQASEVRNYVKPHNCEAPGFLPISRADVLVAALHLKSEVCT